MTDSSHEQRTQTERQIQQRKWEKFANVLRHSADTEHHGGPADRVVFEDGQHDSANGLKSPVLSDEQQSDLGTLGTDNTVDEPSTNGIAEDGFELVVNKRNRTQKQVNGNVWSGAATHLKELHSTSSSVSTTTPHSVNSVSTQPSNKLRVSSAATTNSTASLNAKNAQNKNLTTKTSPYGLIRCMEESAGENDQQDNSNSSDSAFADVENQSPSHGSSASLHFIGASENHNYSDSVALSDEEKWPELNVAIKNDTVAVKSVASPSSPKVVETKSTTPVDESPNPLESSTLNRRGPKPQWKKMDIEINYGKPNEKKHGSSKRNFRSQAASDHEAPQRRNTVGAYNKRRPQSRKSNMSSSDIESQNNNEIEKLEGQGKAEADQSSNNQSNASTYRHAQHSDNSQHQSYNGRRENKSNEQNGRGYRSNNNYRQEQPHYNDYNNRRQMRNPQRVARHSVPNLFQCQPALPVYFMGHEYTTADNFAQPLTSAPAVPSFIYPGITNVMMPSGYPDMSYANAQYLNEYGQQNMFQYRAPFVQLSMVPQNAPYINTSVPATIPESMQMPEPANTEQNLEEELSQLLRRFFIDDNEKTLRDLTEDPSIISQLSFGERCLLLRCQMQFYFSIENLAKDVFLRRHMDDEGFVHLGLFIGFPRIKNLALDLNTIVGTLLHSDNFEVRINEQEAKIRAKSIPHGLASGNSLNSNNASATNLLSGTENSVRISAVEQSHAISPSTTIPSPQAAETSNTAQSSKRPSQTTPVDISVDDVRAKLMGRAKQSPLSSETPSESFPEEESPSPSQQEQEKMTNGTGVEQQHQQEDQWVVYKKKNRQPSANGSVTEPENKVVSKPSTGKPATVSTNNVGANVKASSPRSPRQ